MKQKIYKTLAWIISFALVGLIVYGAGCLSYNYYHPRITRGASIQRQINQLLAHNNRAKHLNNNYQIFSANRLRTQRVIKPTKMVKQLSMMNNQPQLGKTYSTQSLLQNLHRFSNLVQVQKVALAKRKPTYAYISRQGKNLGWININALRPAKEYILPYTYTSQFWPSKAEDACEIASLKTAMSTENKGMHADLRQMVAGIPRSNNPEVGYTHNPYKYGSHATIAPNAMIDVARSYHADAQNISGANKSQFIYEITHGHAVVFEGPYMMVKPGSDHDLTIIGYKPGYFYVTDPFARYKFSMRTTWVSTSKLMRLYNKPFRSQKALVIK